LFGLVLVVGGSGGVDLFRFQMSVGMIHALSCCSSKSGNIKNDGEGVDGAP
jgi:hypothetical protein